MSVRCTQCDHELPATPAPGTPCPRCGAALGPERTGNRRLGRLILVLTSVVMVAVAIVMMFQRQPSAKGEEDIAERVEITITAPRPVPFRIDGIKSGTTPMSIRIKGARTRTMKIEGNGVTVEVTPDRDQVVDLAPSK